MSRSEPRRTVELVEEAMMMLMYTDPLRELDRLTQQVFGQPGTASLLGVMPMEAYRSGDEFVVHFDLPGVDPRRIDLSVQPNVLTVKAERHPAIGDGIDLQVAERPYGSFSRQVFLADTLDTDRIEAAYDAGVLTVRIPVTENSKPHKVEITAGRKAKQLTS